MASPSRHQPAGVIKCEGCEEQIVINLPNTGLHYTFVCVHVCLVRVSSEGMNRLVPPWIPGFRFSVSCHTEVIRAVCESRAAAARDRTEPDVLETSLSVVEQSGFVLYQGKSSLTLTTIVMNL